MAGFDAQLLVSTNVPGGDRSALSVGQLDHAAPQGEARSRR